jgi:integrase
MENLDHRIEDWLGAKCESSKTRDSYLWCWDRFNVFCRTREKEPVSLVDDYRAARKQGETEKDTFLEEWQDVLRAFFPWLKKRYAPLTLKNCLVVLKSFLRFWDLPLKIDLPKHSCVVWHNRDIKKEELKQILTFSSPRDRVIFLVLAESGMRGDTAVKLKYWQLREDFEKGTVPMRILLPSSTLKDHVADRWTFLGEDGYRELKDYLQRRLPLEDDAYVFASERQGRVKNEQFTQASLSVKFNRLIQKLGIDKSVTGHLEKGQRPKPKKVRLHGLRKYFRNNQGADSSYIDFWLGHSLGTDSAYISRDPEEHRKRYGEGYEKLRILEPSLVDLKNLNTILRKKDEEIIALRKQVDELSGLTGRVESVEETTREINKLLRLQWSQLTMNTTDAVLKAIDKGAKQTQKEPAKEA